MVLESYEKRFSTFSTIFEIAIEHSAKPFHF